MFIEGPTFHKIHIYPVLSSIQSPLTYLKTECSLLEHVFYYNIVLHSVSLLSLTKHWYSGVLRCFIMLSFIVPLKYYGVNSMESS